MHSLNKIKKINKKKIRFWQIPAPVYILKPSFSLQWMNDNKAHTFLIWGFFCGSCSEWKDLALVMKKCLPFLIINANSRIRAVTPWTITPRITTTRTITPQDNYPLGQLPPGRLPSLDNYPPGQLPPRTITPRTITWPENNYVSMTK